MDGEQTVIGLFSHGEKPFRFGGAALFLEVSCVKYFL